jgi:hypothetical protein
LPPTFFFQNAVSLGVSWEFDSMYWEGLSWNFILFPTPIHMDWEEISLSKQSFNPYQFRINWGRFGKEINRTISKRKFDHSNCKPSYTSINEGSLYVSLTVTVLAPFPRPAKKVLPPLQIIGRLTFSISNLTTRFIQKFVQKITSLVVAFINTSFWRMV